MADLAAANVSLSVDRYKLGKRRQNDIVMTFGDQTKTYPFGGIPLPSAAMMGFNSIDNMQIIDSDVTGMKFVYDKANHKLKMMAAAPLVVFEEVVTLTGNTTGYTRYPMAWPLYASSGNQAITMLPKGMTPVANTMSINMYAATPGQRALLTCRAADSFATVTISYITQAWAEVFENLVEDETMVAGATSASGIVCTGGTPDVFTFPTSVNPFIVGLMIGLDKNGTISTPKPLQKGQTAVAGEYALDWTDTSPGAQTTIRSVGTDNWDAATTTIHFNFIKNPGAPSFLNSRFIEEDSAASSSQVYTHAAAAALIKEALLWSTPGFMPSVTVATTSATWPIGATGMTLGSTAQWKPTNFYPQNKLCTAGTWTSGTGVLATLTVKPSYIWGVPEDVEIQAPLEIPNGGLVRAKTVRAIVWGK